MIYNKCGKDVNGIINKYLLYSKIETINNKKLILKELLEKTNRILCILDMNDLIPSRIINMVNLSIWTIICRIK